MSEPQELELLISQTVFTHPALDIVARVALGAALRRALVGKHEQVLLGRLHLVLVLGVGLERVRDNAWNQRSATLTKRRKLTIFIGKMEKI